MRVGPRARVGTGSVLVVDTPAASALAVAVSTANRPVPGVALQCFVKHSMSVRARPAVGARRGRDRRLAAPFATALLRSVFAEASAVRGQSCISCAGKIKPARQNEVDTQIPADLVETRSDRSAIPTEFGCLREEFTK